MNVHQPSLLVFTRSTDSECARRRLLPERFADLSRTILARSLESALDAGRAAGCRLEIASTSAQSAAAGALVTRQSGRTFGDRFRNALAGALCRSEGPLVAVGSDVPGLSERHVREALARLGEARDRVVVGPSPDGGFYLLATHRELDRELAHVRWCTRRTLASLIAALEASGLEVCLLEPLRDLDRSQDLQLWVAREADSAPRWLGLASFLRALLADLCLPLVPALVGSTAPRHGAVLFGRAPPR